MTRTAGFLLDTCVVSELVRKVPDANVLSWMDAIRDEPQYLSVLTIGEIQKGIDRLNDSARRVRLLGWFETAIVRPFADSILPVDAAVARRWGTLCAEAERLGRPRPVIDSLLAATAIRYNLVLATRNTSDFDGLPVRLVNPFLPQR